MELIAEFTDEFRASYNRLPEVFVASEQLQARPDFGDFLTGLGQIAAAYDLCDQVGAFLLHRHFDLNPGEAILEAPLEEDGVPVLSSRPVNVRQASTGRPTRWSLSPDGTIFQPLEYSTDDGAIAVERQLQHNEAFL